MVEIPYESVLPICTKSFVDKPVTGRKNAEVRARIPSEIYKERVGKEIVVYPTREQLDLLDDSIGIDTYLWNLRMDAFEDIARQVFRVHCRKSLEKRYDSSLSYPRGINKVLKNYEDEIYFVDDANFPLFAVTWDNAGIWTPDENIVGKSDLVETLREELEEDFVENFLPHFT